MSAYLALQPAAGLAARLPQPWRLPLLHLALAWSAVLVLFAPVWTDMLRQYWDSSTYNHILFVPLILVWLVRMRTPELARLSPQAFWPGVPLFAGALFLWLLGDVSGLAMATHLALVLALQTAVLAILGPRICAALLFPLLYMLFLVPVGDALVPGLQMITAKLTIALTHLSGIPAQIDGVFIDTPAGLFEVAEACSGVKFLVAMVALGALAAHVCFRSGRRRATFMAVAIILPVLANGVRAWGTIYIAQFQGIEFAAGFDHIVFGWIFFALVMALLLTLAWPFFDREVDSRFIDAAALRSSPVLAMFDSFRLPTRRVLLALVACCLGMLAWSASARGVEAWLPDHITLPEVAGWNRVEIADATSWEPRAGGADHRLLGRYRNADGAEVDVFFALYRAQADGREAGAFGEGALPPESAWRWHSAGTDFGTGESDRLRAPGTMRATLTLYRHRDLLTGSVARLKLSNMRDRLLFDPYPTGMLILSAREGGAVPADEAIRQFLASTAPQGEWMDRLAQNP